MCRSIGGSTGGGRGGRQGAVRLIRFETYNIRNGWNRGLEYALRGMYQANMDLGVFHETKVTNGIHAGV